MKPRLLSFGLAPLAPALIALGLAPGCSSSGSTTGATTDAASPGSSGGTEGEGGGSSGSTGGSGSSGGGGSGGSGASSSGASSSSSGTSSGSTGSSGGSGGSDSAAGGADAGSDSGEAADEAAWLDPMNAARSAVGEMPLHWDPIAAQVALAYASECMFMHNPDATAQYDSMGGKGGLGENIAAGAPTQTIAGAVASWVGEETNYDHATNTCASGQVCGHYTQVVWSSTTGVGCAKVHCTTNSPFGAKYPDWDYSVCDYSPPGNYVGMSPY